MPRAREIYHTSPDQPVEEKPRIKNILGFEMRPLAIIRLNLHSPDVEIRNLDIRDQTLTNLLTEISNPNSAQFIESDYLRVRLLECVARIQHLDPVSEDHCPIIFDSWTCFDSAAPSTEQRESCPAFPGLGYSASREAVKSCGEDGKWWRHPLSNR
mgnify:CR=1 FL=1